MAITATELRQNIYRLLDEVLATGIPLEVERHGKRLRIAAADPPSRLDRLVPHPDFARRNLDDFIHIDWSSEWTGDRDPR